MILGVGVVWRQFRQAQPAGSALTLIQPISPKAPVEVERFEPDPQHREARAGLKALTRNR
jgi:hypothetical protein